uniref:Uncharacterized protein n=1 Tax=Halalkalibacterium halodurans TaxID=86665 RepID=A0A0M0KFS1_ALKHA
MTETNSKEITIKQQGDSEWIFNDTKLFEVGETYFLFLKVLSQMLGWHRRASPSYPTPNV